MAVVPSQPPNNPANPVEDNFSTRRAVVSESFFTNRLSLDEIYSYLRSRKVTGQLIVSISQGGKNTVTFIERHDVNGATEIQVP